MDLITIFLTGLITGGLTCMAVQGGLLAATLAQEEEEKLKEKAKGGNAIPILAFLISKLIAYTILGFLLGLFGSFFEFSIGIKVILQITVAIFMIGTALNILNVHPIFRYFVIQPPKFLTRIVRKRSKSRSIFAPATLGAFTIFIPCGTTQAMMALSVASANPILGAAILGAFILGTSPLFFLLGYFATKLGDKLHQKFMNFAAGAIILLAVFNINNAIALSGNPLTLESIWQEFWCTVSICKISDSQTIGTTKNEITIESNGYSPNELTVKKGSSVTIPINNKNGRGCIQAFTIPAFNIQKIIPVGASDTISFTAPTQPGDILFMCSMGMYRGVIHVI